MRKSRLNKNFTTKGTNDTKKIFVIPAKAGTHPAASASGLMGSRFRGNDGIKK